MNNIVDAVNQNGINAIQQAVLARILGGAEANPVMGGVNQAEVPTQDLVSNAMNKQQAVAIPQLMGARATLSGKGGALGGIGDALMNMYNSRIARSENEVKWAQEQAKAKQDEENMIKRFAAEKGVELKSRKDFETFKEGLASTAIDNGYKKALTDKINIEAARLGKTPIRGLGDAAGSSIAGNATDFYTPNPDTGELEFNEGGVKARITTLWNSKNPKDRKEAIALSAMLTKQKQAEEKHYLDLENKRDKYKKEQLENPTPGGAAEVARMTSEINAYRNKKNPKPANSSGNSQPPQGKAEPSVSDLLQKAAALGKPQPKEQVPVIPAQETFVNPQPELLY